jgi:ADP-ribose pyrophosphatase YjhB (NUDIX family)
MNTYAVVAGLIVRGDEVLLLRRGLERRHDPGLWEPVCGFIREHESAEAAILREVAEETGLRVDVTAAGAAFEVETDDITWIVKPFALAAAGSTQVVLDGEHDAAAWIAPSQISLLHCVPDIERNLDVLGLVSLSEAAS